MQKIISLKINSYEDKEKIVSALTNNGYIVGDELEKNKFTYVTHGWRIDIYKETELETTPPNIVYTKSDKMNSHADYKDGVSVLMFDSANLKYMGDLKASERLKNDSLCVIDNGQIRNLKDNENDKNLTLVHVNNFTNVDKDNDYIEQGECVRYRTV